MSTTLKVTIDIAGTELLLRQPRFSRTVNATIKALPSAKWYGIQNAWAVNVEHARTVAEKLAGIELVWSPLARRELALRLSQRAALTETPAGTVYGHAAKPTASEKAPADYTFKTKPYSHQIVAFNLACRKRQFAYLMEMGTGKTKTHIDVLSYQVQRGWLEGALIVCPKIVVFNWEREIAMHSPLPPEKRRTVVLEGSTRDKLAALEATKFTHAFFITNYESLLYMEDALAELMATRKLGMSLDESTRIKSHKASQTKAAHRLGLRAQTRSILTGSPITQGSLDAWGQFGFLDKNILGHKSFYSFKSEYAIMGGFAGKKVVGYKNLERLRSRIAPWSYRVLKQDCLDLPEKIYKMVELNMGTTQKSLYRQMKEEAVLEFNGLEIAAPIIVTKMLRLAQITSGFIPKLDEAGKTVGITPIVDGCKLPALKEILEDLQEQQHKVIIWTRFIHDIECIAALCRELGMGAVEYHGAVDAEARQARVDAFQGDESVRVFIGQIQTGGMAITLTEAQDVIYYSNTFTLADRLQSEDRAHRIGQKRNVTYWDLVCRGTIDRTVLKALRNKKNVADVVNGDNVRAFLEGIDEQAEIEADHE